MNNMPISYMICAAGLGTRTKLIGHAPKPFLILNGRALLQWSIESLPIRKMDQVILIFLAEHKSWVESCDFLKKKNFDIFYLDKITSGQAETAYLARAIIKNESLVIFNSDTYFQSHKLLEYLGDADVDALLPCTIQDGDAWSFCRVSGAGPVFEVSEVTEKKRISNFCSVGFYYFRQAVDFFEAFEVFQTEAKTKQELYVAPFYNYLLKKNRKIRAILVDEFKAIGSLDQIQFFWGKSLSELQSENR